MATLTNTQISVTYVGLLKTSANTVLSSTAQQITDGSGNNSILFLSTAGVGIGGAAASGKELDVTGNVQITGDLIIDNITIDGNTITSASSDFVIDSNGGNIILDSSGGDIVLKDTGTEFGRFKRTGENLVIKSITNDKDIIFKGVDNTSEITALTLDMSEGGNATFGGNVDVNDNKFIRLGTGDDFQLFHDGSNSTIRNYTGNVIIENNTNDGDLIFKCDDGSGGTTAYFTIDGSFEKTVFAKDIFLNDNVKTIFGNSSDLQIYHDGSNSFVQDTGTGGLFLEGNGEVRIRKSATSEIMLQCVADGAVNLYHDNSKKLETTSTGTTTQGVSQINGTDAKIRCLDTADFFYTDYGRDGINAFTNTNASAPIFFKTGGTERARIDASGNLGIGIDPTKKLTVFGTGAGNATVQIEGEGGADPYINFLANNTQHFSLGIDDDDSDKFKLSKHSALGTNDYIVVDTSGNTTFAGDVSLADSKTLNIGTGNDLQLIHDGSNSVITNVTGNLFIRNDADDADIVFQSDDGSGGRTEYFRIDGGTERVESSKSFRFADGGRVQFGTSSDLQIYHDGSNSYIQNETGNLQIFNKADDKDIIFSTDNGSGGTTAYLTLDGSTEKNVFSKDAFFGDNIKALFGAGSDLEIFHDTGNSIIKDNGTGDLYLMASSAVRITNIGASEHYAKFIENGAVELYHDNSKKFETTSTGISVTGGAIFTDDVTIDNSSPEFFLTPDSAKYSWMIAAQENVDQHFEITPSTTVGGSTFNAPAFKINGANNAATFAGQLTITQNSGSLEFSNTGSGHGSITTGSSKDLNIGSGSGNVFINNNTTLNGALSITADGSNAVTFTESGNGLMTVAVPDDFVVDCGSDIILDAAGIDIRLRSNGTEIGNLNMDSSNLNIISSVQDRDILFKGNDGGSTITALTLDMSNGGSATFADDIDLSKSNGNLNFTSGNGNIQTTTGSTSLVFGVNSSEKMRIHSSGNVGINYTTPSAKLHIETGSDEGIRIHRTGTNANFGAIEFRNSDDSATNSRIGYNANELRLEATNTLKCITNSTERLTIDSSGNTTFAGHGLFTGSTGDAPSGSGTFVGLTNNYANLQLNGSNGGHIDFSTSGVDYKGRIIYFNSSNSLVFHTNATTALTLNSAQLATFAGNVNLADSKKIRFGAGEDLQIQHNGTDSQITNLTGAFQFTQLQNDGNILFHNDDGSGGDTEYFRIDGGAEKNIFSKKLEVLSDDGVLIKGGSGTVNGKLSFLPASGGRQYDLRNDGASFVIRDASASVDRMYFHNNGGIGIGTNLPTVKLELKDSTHTTMKVRSGNDDNIFFAQAIQSSDSRIGTETNTDFTIHTNGNERIRVNSSGDVQIGSSGTSNLYLGNIISASSADRGMRLHTNNADFFFDFQGDAVNQLFFRDYDGSGGIHTRHEFRIDNGSITISGTLTQNGSPSDIKYKENIKTISNGIDKIQKLNPVEFDWNDKSDAHKIGKKEDAGFIAQEVQKVLPNLVNENVDGDLALNYDGIIPYLVQSIQELKKEIEILKSK